MRNSACTYILIIADDSIKKLDRTIKSILEQTIDKALLRVLIIDNASQKDAYRKLLDYEIKYPQLISVIREKQPTTRGRLLKRLVEHLRYAEVGSSIILNPGDIIYPDFIKEARSILQLKKELKCLIFEVDILEEAGVKKQTPIFTENCILSRLSEEVYYKYGIGHKVQIVYRGTPIHLEVKLPYYEVMEKNHDWLSVAFYRTRMNVYIKESAGCICEEAIDYKEKLIEWAFFIKRNLYAVETQVFSTINATDLQNEEIETAYNCLAMMALQYALKSLKKELVEEAEDALIFAEMMKTGIVSEECYIKLRKAVSLKKYEEKLELLLESKSNEPPRVCEQF